MKISLHIRMIHIFFLLSLIMHYYTHTRADPLFTICTNTTIYELNSPFESNLKQLLLSLPSKTSPHGYYNTSIGDDENNTVYGLGLCRGDIASKTCQDCIKEASIGIIEICPNNKDATIFYELCQVRYSFQNFFSVMVYSGQYPNRNNSKQNASDSDSFIEILEDLLSDLSSEAAFDGSNGMFFATKEASVNQTVTIYGLAQCTNDISKDDCKTCLQRAESEVPFEGIIVSNSCNMRYELYRFYEVKKNKKPRVAIITSVSICAVLIVLMCSCLYYRRGRKGSHKDEEKGHQVLLHNFGAPIINDLLATNMQEGNQIDNQDLPLIDLTTIKVATNNFSDSNKLGKGGFGIVYKGTLPDGKEIAVKRLSRKSWQGLEEFKNEVKLIVKLQHRNLVRLLGCGIEGEEKLLIYEFMPNRSLDAFIFDPTRSSQLDWQTRFNIIVDIARGLLYLHEDSRLKIIHRDLKPNNVLLDNEMNAKISDFGMARIFGENQSEASTRRVVGTHGYMAPEYAMEGLFSIKSDVFSFGVVLLEIVSGKRSNGFYLTEHAQTLVAYAWCLWKEGKGLDFVDTLLIESCPTRELLRCIHIGLLCVQEDASNRPIMSAVLVMLGSESMDLPQPTQPAFSVARIAAQLGQSSSSVNMATTSILEPR